MKTSHPGVGHLVRADDDIVQAHPVGTGAVGPANEDARPVVV